MKAEHNSNPPSTDKLIPSNKPESVSTELGKKEEERDKNTPLTLVQQSSQAGSEKINSQLHPNRSEVKNNMELNTIIETQLEKTCEDQSSQQPPVGKSDKSGVPSLAETTLGERAAGKLEEFSIDTPLICPPLQPLIMSER